MDTLEELKLDKTTTIISTNDHGYLLDEHHFGKKGNLREEVTRVPFIIRARSYKHGRSSLRSNMSTSSHLHMNLQVYPFLNSFRAKTLCPNWVFLKEPFRNTAHSFVHKGTSLRTKNCSYMQYKDGTEELYKMKRGSIQFHNLSKSKGDLAQLLRHRKLMEEREETIR